MSAEKLNEMLYERVTLSAISDTEAERLSRFERFLNEESETLCKELAVKFSDLTVKRMFLCDIEVLKPFFRPTPQSFLFIDELRRWLKIVVGRRMRVEGDPSFAGFFIAIS